MGGRARYKGLPRIRSGAGSFWPLWLVLLAFVRRHGNGAAVACVKILWNINVGSAGTGAGAGEQGRSSAAPPLRTHRHRRPVLHPPSLLSSPRFLPIVRPLARQRPRARCRTRHARSRRMSARSLSAPPRRRVKQNVPIPHQNVEITGKYAKLSVIPPTPDAPAPQSCGRRSRADAFATQPAPRPARTDLERTTTHTSQAAFAKGPRHPTTAQIRVLRRCELRTLHSLRSVEGKAPASGRVPPPGRVTDCSAQGFALAVDIYCHSFLAGRAADD